MALDARTCTSQGHTATEKRSVSTVRVADPMLVLKVIRLTGEIRFEGFLERSDVVRMHAAKPFLGTADACGRGHANHGPPSF